MYEIQFLKLLGTLLHWVFCILLVSISPIGSSKLNEVGIRNMAQVFDSSNNIIATPGGNGATLSNTHGESGQPLWTNEGFICANATQITSSLGRKIDISTKLLLAMKASMLSTQIKDFTHTFLVIKFSSIIGHTEPTPAEEEPTTTAPDADELITSTSDPVYEDDGVSTSTLSPPPSPLTSSKKLTAATNKLDKTEVKSNNPPNKVSSPLVKSSASEEQVTVKTVPPIPPAPPSPQNPAILKLNTDGSDGHQVIEIAIDSKALSKSTPKKSKRSEGLSEEVDPVSHKIDGKPLQRKRRALDSEEISQIHKILTLTKNMKSNKPEKEKVKSKIKTTQEEITSASQDSQDEDAVVKEKEEEVKVTEPKNSNKPSTIAKKLPYQTWRALMDNSNFRPPGFYVTVDEKVVFDNWLGVWQSSQSPTVMGRWSAPRKNGIWNDTVLLLEFEENPDRNIKVSFEWEPTDANAYLFLSNISISTYGANVTEATIADANGAGPQYSVGSKSQVGGGMEGNRNITLYIVLQTPSLGTEQVIKMGENPEVVEQRITKSNIIVAKPSASSSTLKDEQDLGVKSESNSSTAHDPNLSNSTKPSASMSTTALIVTCVTGGLSLIILIFLIHKKLQINKSPHPIHNLYIDEL
ncbi:uncharacterized protein LOC110852449 [Folsomia candida]|uniref:uncharacterized protein LOC110852449 n=1 Tax=Folsomia candida TaxID=158441 RepID=UPI001605474D|nr:uncharacterized protein LOC110852449 [Folsomia candida]